MIDVLKGVRYVHALEVARELRVRARRGATKHGRVRVRVVHQV